VSAVRVIPCVGCGVGIRRSGRWGFCPACSALAVGWLEREVGMSDPDAWIYANNVVMGRRRVFAALVGMLRAEAGALSGAA
jgi:hypothetical protein